ncbi:MAG: RNA 2',3'-cyclic phosphodiesterase [Methanoregulaceae archaeon]
MIMVRVFVALELPQEMQDAVAKAQETLRGTRARLTFVDPRLIHITLKFLGEVEERRIPEVVSAMKSVKFSPFDITIRSIRGNNRNRPRVVWGVAEDEGRSAALSALLEDALEPLGFEREDRPFTPHATLARVREFHPALTEKLQALEEFPCGCCTIRGMKLKKSVLTPNGPIYSDIAEAGF